MQITSNGCNKKTMIVQLKWYHPIKLHCPGPLFCSFIRFQFQNERTVLPILIATAMNGMQYICIVFTLSYGGFAQTALSIECDCFRNALVACDIIYQMPKGETNLITNIGLKWYRNGAWNVQCTSIMRTTVRTVLLCSFRLLSLRILC